MKIEDFKRILTNKLLQFFTIKKDIDISGEKFDFVGRFENKIGRYFAFKELTFESFESNEIIFCREYKKGIEEKDLKDLSIYLKENCKEIVPPKEDHMSTCLTFILIGDLTDEKTLKKIRKFDFYKSYSFGLKGWISAKLICVDPENSKTEVNKKAKKEFIFIEKILNS